MARTYITETNILNQSGIDLRLGQHLLQQRVNEKIKVGVLEATLAGLGEGSTQCKRNDNVVGVLLGASRRGSTRSELDRIEQFRCAYMVESPFAPDGLRWLRMELKRSVAMVEELEWRS